MKAIAVSQGTTAEAVAEEVEQLFLKLAQAPARVPAAPCAGCRCSSRP